MKTIKIFIIQAYESRTDQGQISDTVTLELIASSEKEAVKKAEGIVKKKFYRLSGVIEKVDDSS